MVDAVEIPKAYYSINVPPFEIHVSDTISEEEIKCNDWQIDCGLGL